MPGDDFDAFAAFRRRQLRVAALALAAAFTFAALGLTLRPILFPPQPGAEDCPPGAPAPACELRAGFDPGAPYEESLGGRLEENVKKVDYALVAALRAFDLDLSAVRLAEVERRQAGDEGYHHQDMTVAVNATAEAFAAELTRTMGAIRANATLRALDARVFAVEVAGVRTHRLRLDTGPDPGPGPDQFPATGHEKGPETDLPRLAVVIDDLGGDLDYARALTELDYPVTFAVWPKSAHAVATAELAHAAGREVILHQPMEPERYPRVKPGPGAVFVDMPVAYVRRTVRENLEGLPHAIGLNNHMGSRFTQVEAALAPVMDVLRAKGLFALDSLTHAKSRVVAAAKAAGVPVYQRDVFLDVVRDEKAIGFQLEKAARIARATGGAIAIGHPFPETLAALRAFAPEGVALVGVSRAVPEP